MQLVGIARGGGSRVADTLVRIMYIVLNLVVVTPILCYVTTTFVGPARVLSSGPSLFPDKFCLSGFVRTLGVARVPHFLIGSLFISLMYDIVHVVITSVTTCTFTFFRFGNGGVLFCLILKAVLVPNSTAVIAGCVAISNVNLIGGCLNVVVLCFISTTGVFLVHRGFGAVPGRLGRTTSVSNYDTFKFC